MPRGGKRKGAGKPAGQPNKPKREAVSRARATGKMPSEIMLENARILQGMAARYQPLATNPLADEAKFVDLLMQSTEAASKAAPYFEYRLASVKMTVEPLDLSKLTDKQIEQLIAIRETATPEGDSPGGAGPTLQ